ncbi:MAG: Mrp/NBP35 family ATP-binding protein [Clostridia bacterium]|nr:Mrp/NBP35 family ATP-binding protein [Clostridia bacterium]
MSQNCNETDCASCGLDCPSRKAPNLKAPLNENSKVKAVVGVCSGKGGVGKSSITAILAALLNRRGYKTGIIDADLTGPSIPKLFGVHSLATSYDGETILPVRTESGIEMISINLLLEEEDAPVVWRGPIISNVITQFWSNTLWEDMDIILIDMPPGTGDVSLTVFQSIPLDGIVMVTIPQDLVNLIVTKSVNMAKMMNIPVLGVVQNMSYLNCPDCGRRINLFGNQSSSISEKFGLPLLGELPLDETIAELTEKENIEGYAGNDFDHCADVIEEIIKSK